MKVQVQSSTLLKPDYNGNPPAATAAAHVLQSPFDRVTDDAHMAVLFAYHPPTPPNKVLARSMATTLAPYREWAGRLGLDSLGNPVILLNDKGVLLVEAVVDADHDEAELLAEPSPDLLALHPSPDGTDELLQLQFTRFRCGTLVVGFTMYHGVADGVATSHFLVAWTRVCRGIGIGRLAVGDRETFFLPRKPPKIEFEHRGVELRDDHKFPITMEEQRHGQAIRTHKVHFSKEFLAGLRRVTAGRAQRRYSTFECLVAHLWRAMTMARRLPGHAATHVRISVNGRARMLPRVPDEYFGNLVLWAYPRTTARELSWRPLGQAATLIHGAVEQVNDRYIKSFVDFASTSEGKGLVPTVDPDQWVLAPNVDVDCWLRFPIREMDVGGGVPMYFVPSYYPVEGLIFLVPSFGKGREGGVDAYVSLFEDDMAIFRQICYDLDHGNEYNNKELDDCEGKHGQEKELLVARL